MNQEALAAAQESSKENTEPKKEVTSDSDNQTKAVSEAKANANDKATYYTVQRGDTLWDIARRYEGVSPDQIKKWNNISSVRSLKPGMKLKINSAS